MAYAVSSISSVSKRSTKAAVAGVVLSLTLMATAHAQNLVDTCGQTVDGAAVLAHDLDCTGVAPALLMKNGASLDLATFSVLGSEIECLAGCSVVGPGEVYGVRWFEEHDTTMSVESATVGAGGVVGTKVVVTDSTVHGKVFGLRRVEVYRSMITDGPTWGVEGFGKVDVVDSTISGQTYDGILCRRCRIANTTISNNGWSGVSAFLLGDGPGHTEIGKAEIVDSLVTDNGIYGVQAARKVTAERTEIRGNVRDGVHVFGDFTPQCHGGGNCSGSLYGKADVSNCIVEANGAGILTRKKIRIEDSTVLGNGATGISSQRVRIEDSTALNHSGADIVSLKRVRPKGTVICDHSAIYLQTGNWGICALD